MFEPPVVTSSHKTNTLLKHKQPDSSIQINMPVFGIVTVEVNLNWFVEELTEIVCSKYSLSA